MPKKGGKTRPGKIEEIEGTREEQWAKMEIKKGSNSVPKRSQKLMRKRGGQLEGTEWQKHGRK